MGRYYINDGHKKELTDNILNVIKSAKSYIKVSSFLMEDESIIKELRNVAYSGKVAVFVISNQNRKEGDEYRASSGREDNPESEGIRVHQMFLQKLYYSGVHIRLLDNLHAKFILADGKSGILMSANISPNSLNKNVETGITLSEEDLKDLELVFDTMYNYADIVQFVKSKNSDVVKKMSRKLPESIFESIKGNLKFTAISRYNTNLSECKQKSLYNSIINIIDNSKEYVYIVAWVFKDKNRSLIKLNSSISRAIKRGVKVVLFYNRNVPPHNQAVQNDYIYSLGSIGCDAYSNISNHSKCILSESQGMLFTANIDGSNGLLEGFEVGCMLDKEQHQKALNHVRELIKIAKG